MVREEGVKRRGEKRSEEEGREKERREKKRRVMLCGESAERKCFTRKNESGAGRVNKQIGRWGGGREL